ncbi:MULTISPECIES: helix-turn-helix transcriptional regulator [unclassified Rheinheimera]|jgi:transcriptional regulator with XRE-family HTH domain|uniref:helix-turn-helix domain-containing protein n=1 Tax=unclassified Rheinheimera TaxID=115860 RepID=UPI002634B157|nr:MULTISPECIES: helix-turn-helix transcriptional regulator [unclassified Rheinheimera]MCA1930286.1 helix-turn-helix domain-containing protein [Rheinheimera sp.]MDF3125226.1 helix-turn-helix transcriptional regulator [Rheinheimera sp. 1928-s]
MRQDSLLLFGLRVRELRSEKGISQEELAALTELDRTYISGIERGKRNLSLKNILKIASALNVTASQLLDIEGLT